MQNKPRRYDSENDVYIQDFVYGISEELSNFEDMPEFDRYGYDFTGWSKSRNSNDIAYENKESVENLTTEENEVVNLYAVWKPKEYVIQYNPNGTIGPVYYQTAFYDNNFNLDENTFELSNYEFLGWSLSDSLSDVTYENKANITTNIEIKNDFDSPTNLFPVFDISSDYIDEIIDIINSDLSDLEISVQYNSNCYPGKTEIVKVDDIFSVKGYDFKNRNQSKIFKSWSAHPLKNTNILSGTTFHELSSKISPIAGYINLYAFWQYPYFVKFYPQNNTYDSEEKVSGTMEVQKIPLDTIDFLEKNLFKSNWHTFIGWTKGIDSTSVDFEDETSVYNLLSTENETLDLYALWSKEYFINYHFNNEKKQQTCFYNLSNELSDGNKIFSKYGHRCIGWSNLLNSEVIYKNNEIVTNISVINGNKSDLSAQFVKYYTIKYDSGVGNLSDEISGEMELQECLYGYEYKLNRNKFLRKNFIFKNWKDSEGNTYLNSQIISNLNDIPDGTTILCAEWEEFYLGYRYDNENKLAYLCAVYGDPIEITIPSKIIKNGADYTVVGIDPFAFYDNYVYNSDDYNGGVPCKNLSNIILPNTISVINNFAFADLENLVEISNFNLIDEISSINTGVFRNCESLVNITLPTNILSVYPNAFYNCYYFNSIDFSNITYIGANAFLGCMSLQNLNLSNINNIETGAFKQCTGISSIFIGENVSLSLDKIFDAGTLNNLKVFKISEQNINITEIPDYFLANCYELSDVQLNNIISFGKGAFEDCNDLSSIDFSDSLNYIGDNCFSNTSLQTVDIPSAVSYIGENAFYMCEDLSAINVDDNNPYYYDIDGVLYKRTENYDLSDIVEILVDLRDDLIELKENI